MKSASFTQPLPAIRHQGTNEQIDHEHFVPLSKEQKKPMASYQEHMLDGASPVDLVVALYDGIIRFLYVAIDAVQRGDVNGRRVAVKRALDILIHLQARLRMDIGGRPAQVLSEFYAAMFALILQGSQGASAQRFEQVISCVRNVRDAWRQVASDPTLDSAVARNSQNARPLSVAPRTPPIPEAGQATRWTA
jgi:flagellar protein FliS